MNMPPPATAPTATPRTRSTSSALTPPVKTPSRARRVVEGWFAGTPGSLRLRGAICVFMGVAFGVAAFSGALALDRNVNGQRNDAAQLVRVESIRTNLVKADANATNAFLVGGLEPVAARAAYTAGISAAARSLAEAAGANGGDAPVLRQVNAVVTTYTGLIESARANNRQGFPIGAAYLRQASKVMQEQALPALDSLVTGARNRVDDASRSVALPIVLIVTLLALAMLIVLQVWIFRRTHRVFNLGLVAATALIVIIGGATFVGMNWSQSAAKKVRVGAFARTVALATARSDGFDAKSAEALTLVNRGSGQAYEARFVTVAKSARDALRSGAAPVTPEPAAAEAGAAFEEYLVDHAEVRRLDDGGEWEKAVASATGTGAANQSFGRFERASGRAIDQQAAFVAEDLDSARWPLVPLAWLALLAGLLAAATTARGLNQRLREYR